MGMALVQLPDAFENRRTFGFIDDLEWFVTAHRFTSLAADTGASVAVGDEAGGVAVLTSGATDNNEALLRTTNEAFLVAADRPLLGEARVKFAEAATNAANVAFGFADAMGADLLLDNGAGPKASFSGALIYKVDGETAWRCVSSVGTSRTVSTSTTTAGGSAWQTLRVEIRPTTSTVAEVTFWVDGQQLFDAAILGRNVPIKHYITYTSATEMHAGVYVKAGSAASQVARADYVAAFQVRP